MLPLRTVLSVSISGPHQPEQLPKGPGSRRGDVIFIVFFYCSKSDYILCTVAHFGPGGGVYIIYKMSQSSARLCAQCVRAASRAGGALNAAAARGSGRLHARESRRCVHYAGAQQLRYPVGYGPSVLDTRCESGAGALEKQRIRHFATASEGVALREDVEEEPTKPTTDGPIPEYNARVQAGTLRDDPHQRGMLLFFFFF